MGQLKPLKKNEDSTADPFFNPEDFRSIRLRIGLSNLTAKTEIKGGQKGQGGRGSKGKKNASGTDTSIELTEFLEHGVVLEVPSQACAKGHQLLLDLKVEGAKDAVAINVTGKVESVERITNDRDTIRIAFTQLNELDWQKLQRAFSQRQNEIMEFFKAVKE